MRLKGRIIWHSYGNTTVLAEQGSIVHLSIDFEAKDTQMVGEPDPYPTSLSSWMSVIEERGIRNATQRVRMDVATIVILGAQIHVDSEGRIHVLTLDKTG